MPDINPRVDIAFKKIFGIKENKDLLISLINSIVGKADQVTDVTLLNPYNPKTSKPISYRSWMSKPPELMENVLT